EGGWRVCIVDTADELQYPQAANALLKILEEPPPNALLLLISHAPARLLPTIRSRCRRLTLRPLSAADVARAAALALGRDAEEAELREASTLAEGSVGRALTLLEGPALALRKRVVDLLERLPAVDPQALHALGGGRGAAGARGLHGARHGRAGAPPRRGEPRADAAHRGSLGQGQPGRPRCRRIQSGTQAAGFLGVRLAQRGSSALILVPQKHCCRPGRAKREPGPSTPQPLASSATTGSRLCARFARLAGTTEGRGCSARVSLS